MEEVAGGNGVFTTSWWSWRNKLEVEGYYFLTLAGFTTGGAGGPGIQNTFGL